MDEFFTFNNLKTLGGSSTAVLLATGVIGYTICKVFPDFCGQYPEWLKLLALVLSILISFGITVSRKKKMAKYYLLAFLNGLLIFSTATGYNTILSIINLGNEDTSKGKELNLIQDNVYRSSILSYINKPWFLPKTLVDENETLVMEKEKILVERDSVINVNKKLSEEIRRLPKNEKDFKNKLDSLNNVSKGLLQDNNNLKKDIEKLRAEFNKQNIEEGDYKNRFTKLQADYRELQNKYNNLEKECSGYARLKNDYEKLKQECSGYAQLKNEHERLRKDYEKLQRDCDQLKKEYEELKSGSKYETISQQLQECNRKLRECLSKRDTIK